MNIWFKLQMLSHTMSGICFLVYYTWLRHKEKNNDL